MSCNCYVFRLCAYLLDHFRRGEGVSDLKGDIYFILKCSNSLTQKSNEMLVMPTFKASNIEMAFRNDQSQMPHNS